MEISVNPQLTGQLNLSNMSVINSRQLCFAVQNITTGGNGTSFVVQLGGSVDLIGSQYVKLLTGTTGKPGGYLHALVTNQCIPCSNSKSTVIASLSDEAQQENINETFSGQAVFKVYPNPTTGDFVLEILNARELQALGIIRIHNMFGEEILRKEFKGKLSENLSLKDQPAGIYLISVMFGERLGTLKILKR
jgi:hypothetical protein